MKVHLVFAAVVAACGFFSVAAAAEFEKPIQLKGGDAAIRVESPGYAAPCWADIDNDGLKDLLVGQFRQGKIHVFRNLGDNKLAKGQWLMVDNKPAEIPGVW